jgi:hypothetical protein
LFGNDGEERERIAIAWQELEAELLTLGKPDDLD